MNYRRKNRTSTNPLNDTDIEVAAENVGLNFNIGPEVEEGNVEYKFKLSTGDEERIMHLSTQLNWRLNEGENEAIYKIGVQDDGFAEGISADDLKESIRTLSKMAKNVNAKIISIKRSQGAVGVMATVHIRRLNVEISRTSSSSVRIAMLGDSNSGKTTLVSVLSKGILDNGSGLARLQILRHYHEVDSGKSSSVTMSHLKNLVFVDLCGDSKYLNTTLTGLISHKPDLCIIVVDNVTNVSMVVKDHVNLCLALGHHILFVEAKIDIRRDGNDSVYDNLSETLKQVSDSFVLIKLLNQESFSSISSSFTIPYIPVSCVTGEGLCLLLQFINSTPARLKTTRHADLPTSLPVNDNDDDTCDPQTTHLMVTEIFHVSGVDKVVGGIVLSGSVVVDSMLHLGPISSSSSSSGDRKSEFIAVKVVGISNGISQISSASLNMLVSIGLECIDLQVENNESMDDVCLVPLSCGPPTQLKRSSSLSDPELSTIGPRNVLTHLTSPNGLILTNSHCNQISIRRFHARVVVLNHRDGLKMNATFVVHIRNISQAVRLLAILTTGDQTMNDDDGVRLFNGDIGVYLFEFVNYAVVGILVHDEFVLRDNRVIAVGHVTELR